MPRASVTTHGDKELIALFKKMPKEAEILAEEAIKNVAVDAIGDITRTAPVDTGNLRRNIKFEELANGDVEISSIALNDQGQDYAAYVEYGTRFTKAQPYFWHNITKARSKLMGLLNNILQQISKK